MRIIAPFIFILVVSFGYSQNKKREKEATIGSIQAKAILQKNSAKYTNLGIGVGFARSVIFLSRNIKEFNDATGLNVGLVYGGNNLIRLGLDYSQFNSLNIEPTWMNIKARTYEANIHFVARFKGNRALVYPIVGLSVNEFRGFFTGIDDFQNLRGKYRPNTNITAYWIGMNFGLGFEHNLGPFKLTIAYKMRIGTQDVNEHLNIMDVCYAAGLRYDIKTYRVKYFYRRIIRGYRSRYYVD
jgi:hypothetical protein